MRLAPWLTLGYCFGLKPNLGGSTNDPRLGLTGGLDTDMSISVHAAHEKRVYDYTTYIFTQ